VYKTLLLYYTAGMYAAVDIGGTKTLVAIFDKDKNIVEQHKFPTNHDYELFKIDLAKAVAELSTHDFLRVVTAVPGKVDRKHGIAIAFGNLPWEHVRIERDLEHIFQCPVLIENDANLAGLGEAVEIPDYKKKAVLYITVSTGIGGGYISQGKIDPKFEDAEIGHMKMEYQGRIQDWEHFASGSAIYKKYGKKASEIEDPQAWYVISRNLALGMISVIAVMTPDVIVIGGGVGSHFDKFEERLKEELKLYETPLLTLPELVQAKHPEEAVLFGCYEFAKQHHR
jgi:predicted NBD/HSP70 family sugar kinase